MSESPSPQIATIQLENIRTELPDGTVWERESPIIDQAMIDAVIDAAPPQVAKQVMDFWQSDYPEVKETALTATQSSFFVAGFGSDWTSGSWEERFGYLLSKLEAEKRRRASEAMAAYGFSVELERRGDHLVPIISNEMLQNAIDASPAKIRGDLAEKLRGVSNWEGYQFVIDGQVVGTGETGEAAFLNLLDQLRGMKVQEQDIKKREIWDLANSTRPLISRVFHRIFDRDRTGRDPN